MTMTDELDRQIAAWGRTPAGSDAAVARLLAATDLVTAAGPQARPGLLRRWMAPAAGGVAVAAVGLALLLTTPSAGPPAAGNGSVMTASLQQPISDSAAQESFTMLYTPTRDEEYFL